MGNNPISRIDPDGGTDDLPDGPGDTVGQRHFDENTGITWEWDGKNWQSDLADGINIGAVTIDAATKNASGVSDDSLLRYTPVVGSFLDSWDAFGRGDYWTAAFHGAMAISDVFLVKSIIVGAGKYTARTAFKYGSHNWGATRKWLGSLQIIFL